MDRYLDEGKTPPLVSEALLHVTAGWTRRRYLSHPGQSIDPHLPNEQLNPPHEEDQVLRRSTDIFYKKGQEERLEHEYNPVVSVVEQEGRPVLFLQGTVDIFSAQELYQVALQLLERGEDTAVCWGQADHMDTTALQILLALRKGLAEKGKSLQMQDASSAVTTLLPMTGLTNAFGAAGDKQLTEASDL
jgi:anti-anti-sigma factor